MKKFLWLGLRLVMSGIFLWAFADKTFGLGFATKSTNAWIHGGSPTSGFLTNAVSGPLAEIFRSLSGVTTVDWLFMLGLLFVGATLLLNKYVPWGAGVGSLMMVLIYLADFPPSNNPLIDEHVVYILVLGLLAYRNQGRD